MAINLTKRERQREDSCIEVKKTLGGLLNIFCMAWSDLDIMPAIEIQHEPERN